MITPPSSEDPEDDQPRGTQGQPSSNITISEIPSAEDGALGDEDMICIIEGHHLTWNPPLPSHLLAATSLDEVIENLCMTNVIIIKFSYVNCAQAWKN